MLSQHAERRCQQRGVSRALLKTILDEADTETAIGDNCRLHRVSRRTARARGLDDRVARFAVILSDDSQKIVTVLPMYRRGSGGYSRRT